MKTRNVAIVAHVDHGKTTLIDGLLRQSGAFRAGAELVDCVMDSGDQERERGITILAKCTAVEWEGNRINIVDTPGHADFSSEVERVLRMVDATLLLVDAAEGPMPQTRYVLQKSLELGHKVLVCINKIDRPDARTEVVLDEIFDLFAALEANDEQLDFPYVYAAARDGYAIADLEDERVDLSPLFELLLAKVPAPHGDPNGTLQLQVATLDYSPYLGRIAIGRISRGSIARGMNAVVCNQDGEREPFKVRKLMRFQGLDRIETEEVAHGDLVALAGAGSATVGDTICPLECPDPLPAIPIDKPTLKMHFIPNTSPFSGTEGSYLTSRQISERLAREIIANVGIEVEPQGADAFTVSGRGTLHLSVLIEAMRREGFELAISRPQVILRKIDDVMCEPFETVVIDCANEHSGGVVEKLNQRNGELRDLYVDLEDRARMSWVIPSRGLIGYRSEFLTDTRGTGNLYHRYSHYGPCRTHKRLRQNGVLIAQNKCKPVAYALNNLQARGQLFIGPAVEVYGGQIIGLHSRDKDLVVNPAKGKKLTNMRASGTDDTVQLTPHRVFSLEEALEFIDEDELVEVTPSTIRLRKRVLDPQERKRVAKMDSN